MIRWRQRYTSHRSGLVVIALAAITLPLVLLSVVQYRSLVDLESKTRVVVRENLSRTLDGYSRRVREKLEVLAAQSLGRIDPVAVEKRRLDQLSNQLLIIRRERPEIEAIFVVNRCSSQKESFAIFSTPEGNHQVSHEALAGDAKTQTSIQLYNQAELLQGTTGEKSKLLFEQTSCPLFSGQGGKSQLVILSTLRGFGGGQRNVITGMILKPDYIGGKLLPQSAREFIEGRVEKAGLAISVLDENDQEIYAIGRRLGRYEATAQFAPVLRRWKTAIGYEDGTTQTLARKQFRQNLALSAFTLSLLIGGLGLTLRAATRERRLLDAKSSFVSNVSHEMKTPLASIRLFAETLELGRVGGIEEMQEYGRIIGRESVRLTQLINNILDFSRIEAGKRAYRFVETDLAIVVEEAFRRYEAQLRGDGFLFNIIVEPGSPSVLIDREAMMQATLNLIDNAIRYSTDVKRIEARIERRGENVAIDIADWGIGVPHSERRKIFEKFYRVDDGLVHNTKGSGLGLAIVSHIVEAHRGRILLESAPGHGSRFTILLPLSSSLARRSYLCREF